MLATPAAADDDKVTANDMKMIGLAYHVYSDTAGKSPAKAEDLEKYLGDDPRKARRLLEMIKPAPPDDGGHESEKVKFIFNVGIRDMLDDGLANTVIAYETAITKNGGLVLYGDGSVKKLSADDFKKAILAKPKARKDK
jgi:hypothetical protein